MTAPLLFLIRHGQTDWNAEYRLQGQAETDINAVGRAQAEANGRRLAGLLSDPRQFDFVASPMRRTRQTMEIVRRAMGLDPEAYRTDPRLREVHFGDWQGFTLAELEARSPGSTAPRAADKWGFVPPGKSAESYALLAERVRPWLEELDRPTVCVAHGGITRSIFQLVARLESRAAAELDIPQDRILRVEAGRLEWV